MPHIAERMLGRECNGTASASRSGSREGENRPLKAAILYLTSNSSGDLADLKVGGDFFSFANRCQKNYIGYIQACGREIKRVVLDELRSEKQQISKGLS